MKKSLTVLVPAYNEEKNLLDAVNSLLKILKKNVKDYEILIFDDHSTDSTGKIADLLALKDKKIRVFHNKKNRGMGYNYLKGIQFASKEYYTLFPGDNENDSDYFGKMLDQIGKADIILSYTLNQEVRSFKRRFLSKTYVFILNKLFNLDLRYYNGNSIFKTDMLRKIKVSSEGFAYSTEILIRLIRRGSSYIQFGVKIKPTQKSSAFKIKNVLSVFKTIFHLFCEDMLGRL